MGTVCGQETHLALPPGGEWPLVLWHNSVLWLQESRAGACRVGILSRRSGPNDEETDSNQPWVKKENGPLMNTVLMGSSNFLFQFVNYCHAHTIKQNTSTLGKLAQKYTQVTKYTFKAINYCICWNTEKTRNNQVPINNRSLLKCSTGQTDSHLCVLL